MVATLGMITPGGCSGAAGQTIVTPIRGALGDGAPGAQPPERPRGFQEPPFLQALQVTPEEGRSLRLDGLLAEEIWFRAQVLSRLTQREPLEGEKASEDTEVRVLFDDENLYVGIRALDSEPDRVVSRILQRDRIMTKGGFSNQPEFAGDDAVAILLDPFLDRRNAYIFATNPNGAEFDALLADEGKEVNTDWRGVWEVAAARTPDGWSAEFRIPLRTLRYPDASTRPWGFNVYRTIRRKNEEVLWQGWSRDGGGFHRVSLAGHLEGLQGLRATGANVEVKPYVAGGQRLTRADGGGMERDWEREVGLDLKTEVRPGLVLDLTLNTDFAQVEVDDQQVNLTRFSLFYPEKRDFFLENSGVFDFGLQGSPFETPPFQLFFSRRIGIQEGEGEMVPILGGARLTGRVGGQTLGFLTSLMDELEGVVSRESFTVARVKRDVGENNYVGIMLTDRRTSAEANTALGVDGSFYLTPSLHVYGWAAHTYTRGEGGDDLALGFAWDYTADLWGGRAQYLQVGPDVEAASGFVQRTDVRRVDVHGRRSFRPGRLNIRKVDLRLGANVLTGLDGGLQDYGVGPILSTELETGDQVTVMFQKSEARPRHGFQLAGRLPVPPGEYDATHRSLRVSTGAQRPVVFSGSLRLAEFYGGTLRSGGGSLTMAPTPRVSAEVGINRNRVEVPSGSFTSDILSLRAGFAFSTRLYTNLLVQHNSLEGFISTNLRVNFIHRPGSDLFLVFTEGREDDGGDWRTTDRGMVVKLTYLRRF
jgi:hypothetical protein